MNYENDLDNDYQSQMLNEYYEQNPEEIHWKPVAKLEERDIEFEKHIAKLMAMKRFNEGR